MAWKWKADSFSKQKCFNCLYNNMGTSDAFSHSCLTCIDRPNRYKDKSEFIEDLTDEAKERMDRQSEERVKRIGKYGY